MKINNFYDKIGLSILGFGLDGIFIHSDLSSWIDNNTPYFLASIVKIIATALGIYLISLYNKSNSTNDIGLDVDIQLQRRRILAKKVNQYSWYLLFGVILFLVSFNNDETVSSFEIALFLIVFWIIIIWPIIYFWRKSYTNPNNILDLQKLQNREELIKNMFFVATKQYSKLLNFSLIATLVVPIVFAIFPFLVEQSDPGSAAATGFAFMLFMSFLFWAIGLYYKNRVKNVKKYYLENPTVKIWASEHKEHQLQIKFDDKKIELGKLFLPLPIERCIKIINNLEETKIENTILKTETMKENTQENQEEIIINIPATAISNPNKYYVAPKTVNIGLLLFYSILFFPVGIILAFIYSYLIWYIPIPYFNFFITAGFGVILSFILPIKLSKCTNSNFAIGFALIFALVSHYFSWAVWMDLFLNQGNVIEIDHAKSPVSSIVPSSSNLDQIIFLLKNPSVLFNYMSLIAKEGYFTIFYYQPKGFVLYAIWVIEMLMIIFLAVFTSNSRSNEPFSVKNNKWYPSFEYELDFITDTDKLLQELENNETTYLISLKNKEPDSNYSEFKLWYLENDQSYLSVKNKVRKVDEKGKIDFEEIEITNYLKVDDSVVKLLMFKNK